MKHIITIICIFVASMIQAQTTFSVVTLDSTVYVEQKSMIPVTAEQLDKDIEATAARIEKLEAEIAELKKSLGELARLKRLVAIEQDKLKHKP